MTESDKSKLVTLGGLSAFKDKIGELYLPIQELSTTLTLNPKNHLFTSEDLVVQACLIHVTSTNKEDFGELFPENLHLTDIGDCFFCARAIDSGTGLVRYYPFSYNGSSMSSIQLTNNDRYFTDSNVPIGILRAFTCDTATSSHPGLMSAADKTKIDNLPTYSLSGTVLTITTTT